MPWRWFSPRVARAMSSPLEAALLIRGLYEVAIPVRQLQKAESFYRDVLGLEVGLRDEQRKWLFLRAGGAAGMIVLQEYAAECPRHHFAFAVRESDLEEA